MENGILKVANKEYNLIKKGRDQAEQAIQLGVWINTYGLPAAMNITDEEGNVETDNILLLIGKILEQLNADALLSLYALVIGCTNRVADKHFDIGDLMDSLSYVYENQIGFRRLVSRFFSQVNSEENTETESSTTSE
jgi:hypothetical protein